MANEPRLSRHEVSLIKAMLEREAFTKDRIQSYFSRPDRTVNFGRIRDIETGKLGAEVEAADEKTLTEFVEGFGKSRPEAPGETDPLSTETLDRVFRVNPKTGCLIRDESDTFEAKQTFHARGPNFAKYAKTAAGFANAAGGYLVFGVNDANLEVVGLSDDRFTKLDKAEITQKFGQYLAPSIRWDRRTHSLNGKSVGVIFVYSSAQKPVVSRLETDGLRDGAIYYRYIGETREVRSAELHEILSARDRRAGEALANVVSRVSDIGVQNVGIFDVDSGVVEGARGAFVIDETLLPKLSFIKEGEFEQTKGAPTLRLLGDVEGFEPDKTQAIYISGRAISEQDIVRNFINQNAPGDPREFIRQQLQFQKKRLPLFYFASKAKLDRDGLIDFIEQEPHATANNKSWFKTRAKCTRPIPTESRRNIEELVAKLANGEIVRVTPENGVKVAKALRALKGDEFKTCEIFRHLKALLALYDEHPSPTLYAQLRLTASYIDEALYCQKFT